MEIFTQSGLILLLLFSNLVLCLWILFITLRNKLKIDDDINNLLESRNYIYEKFAQWEEKLSLQPQMIGLALEGTILRQNDKTLKEFFQLKESILSQLALNNKNFNQEINSYTEKTNHALYEHFKKMSEMFDMRMDRIEQRVDERLSEGFKKTNKTFIDVMERLALIDAAQRQIRELSHNVMSLQDVLTDKKSRGVFGEVQLKQILQNIFGEKNSELYQEQFKLSTGAIVDAILFLPQPIGNLSIDSKFPLENYEKMFDSDLSDIARAEAKKAFKADVKKHIDDIASKYIIKDETSDQAVLFLPAEAIFAELNAYHIDVIEYASKKRVWLTSPTTLMSMLAIVQVTTTEIKRSKYMNIIHDHINKLGDEFSRFKKRWDGLNKSIDKVSKDIKDINTTSKKITKRFDEIRDVNLDDQKDQNNIEPITAPLSPAIERFSSTQD